MRKEILLNTGDSYKMIFMFVVFSFLSYQLSGQAQLGIIEPAVGLSVYHGIVEVGTTNQKTVIVKNVGTFGGNLTGTISLIHFTGSFTEPCPECAFWTVIGGNTISLGPNASMAITLQFHPTDNISLGTIGIKLRVTATNSAPTNYTDRDTSTPALDVDISVSGTSAKMPIILECENASLYGALNKSTYSGFTGTGYADFINNSNDYIRWSVLAPVSGQYKLDFRYANGTTKDRPLEIRVNNVVTEPSKSFPSTTLWTTWSEVSSTVNLVAGSNTIEATAIGLSGGNFDHLTVSSASAPMTAAPTYSVVLTAPTAGSTIYYTVDGSSPTQSSSVYSSPIPISSATAIKSFSHASGYSDSPISTFTADVVTSSITNATLRSETAPSLNPFSNESSVVLYQNKPNPFKYDTEVRMFLPQKTQYAVLFVYDFNGKLVKQFVVDERGETTVRIEGGDLKAGIYAYTLVADGEIAGTLRMVLTE